MSVDADLIAALASALNVPVFVAGGRQGTDYPYVTVQRISWQGASHMNGPSTLEWPRFQIDYWADAIPPKGAPSVVLDLAEQGRVAIDCVPISGFTATFQDQRGPEPDPDTRIFRVSQDYLVFHNH